MAICIFCLNDRTLTFEHLFPVWLDRLLPGDRTVEIQASNEAGLSNSYKRKTLRAGARVVCADCNNGWMSELESGCKDSLMKIFVADVSVLDEQDLRNIARWSIKTAIIASYAHQDISGRLSLEISNAFFRNRIAPPHSAVYFGSYRGSWLHGFRFSKEIPRFLRIDNDGYSGPEIYDWTASVLGAVLKVVLFPPQVWRRPLRFTFPQRRPLAPAWPIRLSTIDWPVLPNHVEVDVVLSSYALLSGQIELTT